MPSLRTLSAAVVLLPILMLGGAPARAQSGTLTQLPSGSEPLAYGSSVLPTMAFDAARRRLVLMVGQLFGYGIDTFEYDGVNWNLMSSLSTTGGALVTASNMVWDEVRQSCLVVTTTGHTLYLSEWRQGSWQPLATVPLATPGTTSLALARDPLQSRAVIVASPPGQTFVFDGVQITAAGSGPLASLAAFDPVRGQVVALAGGRVHAWNGTAWTLLPNLPLDQVLGIATDPVLPRVLGIGTGGLSEWTGSRWRRAVTVPFALPAGRILAIDPLTGDAFVVALASNGVAGSTWRYRELSPVPGYFAFHGAGCAGPLGVPRWIAPGDPPRFARELVCAVRNVPTGASNATIALFGTDAANWNGQPLPLSLASLGAPGCLAWLAPAFALPMLSSGNQAALTIGMPASPAAVGQQFYVQAATLVPAWNALGAVFSDAAVGHIGTR
ncbi:MAG: hypothetical protein KDE27_27075 [Planctomycetes bacterium]|nr:hypothetical protein [Planctomycetota bacterium]